MNRAKSLCIALIGLPAAGLGGCATHIGKTGFPEGGMLGLAPAASSSGITPAAAPQESSIGIGFGFSFEAIDKAWQKVGRQLSGEEPPAAALNNDRPNWCLVCGKEQRLGDR
ncbi:MAG: hypothetical protein H6922_00315 [Pseudomonadaceae bacterium]|nr:hypothetical protein [Pseudomonadaceae bacterium]